MEKSCLKYASYFGEDSDISVACCGSNIINYQIKLLLSLEIKEIIVAFDKQFEELGNEEWRRWITKLKAIYYKYSNYVKISYIFDKEKILDYKESPVDRGKDVFIELFKNRITIE